MRTLLAGADQQRGEGHRKDLVRYAMHVAQWLEQNGPILGDTLKRVVSAYAAQLPVNPANQVTVSDVANKQKQAVGDLVEDAVAKIVTEQGAGRQVAWLGAGLVVLTIATAMELPVTPELGAARRAGKRPLHIGPTNPAMTFHVAVRHRISDPLIAQYLDQPLVQRTAVVGLDGVQDPALL
jgi:hypothetical protein